MKIGLLALTFFVLCCTLSFAKEVATHKEVYIVGGHGTQLNLTVEAPLLIQHDSDNWGHAQLTLKQNGRTLFERGLVGSYSSIGYSPARKAYVLRRLGEIVSVPEIIGIEYVSEEKPALSESRFSKEGYNAVSLLPSPDNRFIVFVGNKGMDAPFKLYCLDVLHDTIRTLGAPPAPPPLSKTELAAGAQPYQWNWGLRGLEQLDVSIWHIDGHTLTVNYGADTWKTRAKKRTPKTYALDSSQG